MRLHGGNGIEHGTCHIFQGSGHRANTLSEGIFVGVHYQGRGLASIS